MTARGGAQPHEGGRRRTRGLLQRTGTLILLVVTYWIMTSSLAPANLLVGGSISAIIWVLVKRSRDRDAPAVPYWRLFSALWLVYGAVRMVLDGVRIMAPILVGLRTWRNIGNVRVPIGERSDRGVDVNAFIASAAPGTVLVEVDHEESEFVMNVIDASDGDALVRDIDSFYENHQRPIVP